ncbi:archaeosine biosynthesis radical SAM protein RaSEA [Oxyplasma meridianum]|uniref:Archaeosine biosynthesis radical SAM protein RaSEA n=1 Tax=Oxyplasma meridianum TaxID=3073602 RepID=A0AAX4NG48_9ARCH
MINREYAKQIKKLMPNRESASDPNSPVSMWKEMDRLRGYPEPTSVVIFRTKGCSWYNFSSCSMCGYFNDVSSSIKEEDLYKQVDYAFRSLGETRILKVFTSGSFLDPLEVPIGVRDYFMEKAEANLDKLLVESRTEYINARNLSGIKNYGVDIRIAIGLESSNDTIVRESINKGSTFAKFVESARVLKDLGLELRTYLLLKPPFVSEKASVEDMIRSIKDVSNLTDDVSINPMNIQKNTMVEKLWKKGLYRPPRLWSIARILLESRNMGTQVISYPTGGNKIRGAHNQEDSIELLNLIFSASLTQDFSDLETFYNNSDKSSYFNDLCLEDSMVFQQDLDRMVDRLGAASMTV